MSIPAINWAVHVGGLSCSEKAVLFVLAYHHSSIRGCFPSRKIIAVEAGMQETGVSKVIARLVEFGLLTIAKVGRRNAYRLNFDEVEWAAGKGKEVAVNRCSSDTCEPTDRCLTSTCDRCLKDTLNIKEGNIKESPHTPQGGQVAFDEFWSVVWIKKGRAASERAWKRMSDKNRRLAIDSAKRFWSKWRDEYPDASPIHPATYLNGRRWEDYAPEEKPAHVKADRKDNVIPGNGLVFERGALPSDRYERIGVLNTMGVVTERDPRIVSFRDGQQNVYTGTLDGCWMSWSDEYGTFVQVPAPDGYTEEGRRVREHEAADREHA